MTSFDDQIVCCFCCGTSSSQQILLSTNRSGSPDLDQRSPEMMRSTMDAWLQQCPSCNYVAADLRKGDAGDRRFVSSEAYQAVRAQPHASGLARRFVLGAAIAGHREDMEGAFKHTLSAAWIADDLARCDVAKELRRQAAGYVLGRANTLDLRLVLLDVLRRASEWEAAGSLAAEMSAESLDHSQASIVRFQSDKIEAHDDTCYAVGQVPSLPRPSDPETDAWVDRIAPFIKILPPMKHGR